MHCCCCWDFSSSPEFNLYLDFEVIVPPLGLACAWSRLVVFQCGFTWTKYIYIFLKKWIFKTAKYWKIKSQWCSMRSSLCSFKPCRPSWSWAWSCNGPTYMATLDARSVEDPICRHWLRTILVHSFSSRYTIFFSLSKFSSSFVVIHMRTFFFWFAYLTKGNGENTEVLNSHRTTGPSTTRCGFVHHGREELLLKL